jgi:hypothetical protein
MLPTKVVLVVSVVEVKVRLLDQLVSQLREILTPVVEVVVMEMLEPVLLVVLVSSSFVTLKHFLVVMAFMFLRTQVN